MGQTHPAVFSGRNVHLVKRYVIRKENLAEFIPSDDFPDISLKVIHSEAIFSIGLTSSWEATSLVCQFADGYFLVIVLT